MGLRSVGHGLPNFLCPEVQIDKITLSDSDVYYSGYLEINHDRSSNPRPEKSLLADFLMSAPPQSCCSGRLHLLPRKHAYLNDDIFRP